MDLGTGMNLDEDSLRQFLRQFASLVIGLDSGLDYPLDIKLTSELVAPADNFLRSHGSNFMVPDAWTADPGSRAMLLWQGRNWI